MRKMDDHEKIFKILNEHGKQLEKIIKLLSSSETQQKLQPVKKKNPKSVSGLIERMKDESFFDTPKTLGEIAEGLKQDGYYYKTTSLTNPLRRLLQKRVIGRISVNGKWAYVKR